MSLNDIAADWLAELEARTRYPDQRRSRSPRTVAVNRQRLTSWALPELGHRPAEDLTVRDVRRLIDRMAAAGRAPSTITGTVFPGCSATRSRTAKSAAMLFVTSTATTAPAPAASANRVT